MKLYLVGVLFLFLMGCNNSMETTDVVFLHHSTGGRVWRGNVNKYMYKVFKQSKVEKWISRLNKSDRMKINITQQTFPKKDPYGWKNYPYDYFNIWVKNGGSEFFMTEPTLETLTRDFNIIIWKHCFPVSSVLPDAFPADIDSEIKTLANYKLQYVALKEKMHHFPDNKFIVWTPAPLVESKTSEDEALRIKEFYNWVINVWDEKNDNIYLWDYYWLAVGDGLYLKPEHADAVDNSHPNRVFSDKISKYFANRIIQVVQGEGDRHPITGMEP